MNSAHNEELILVEKAKSDFSAFGKLYEIYFKRIYTYVYRMVESHDVAEDIVSQTFEKALRNISTYEYKGYSFGSWLYTIARNLVFDHSNYQKKLTPLDDENVIQLTDHDSEKQLELGAEKEVLYEALSKLKEEDREVIILRYIEEYSIKEVAEMLGASEDSVKSRAKRSLQKLKLILTDHKEGQ